MQPPISGSALTLVTPVLQAGATSMSVDSTVLPYDVLADSSYVRLEVSIYGTVTINGAPLPPVSGKTHFVGTIAIDTQGEQAVLQFLARNYDPMQIMTWAGRTLYAVGFRFVDANGYVQAVTAATGPTGASQPVVFTPAGIAQDIPGTVTQDGGTTWKNMGFYEVSPTVGFTVIPFVSGSSAVIGPPSGISSYKSQVACRVEWLMPTFPGTMGTKVMLSTDPAGVSPPYVQYGDVVPTSAVSRTSIQVIDSSTSTSYDPTTGKQVITTVNQTQEFTYNYVDIPPSAVNGAAKFYAMLSTVVQDPVSSVVFESQQNGPVTCGFADLSLVSPTDFLALQRKEDIAGRLIAYMTQLYPDLDLTPRSEPRDLLIDPVAIELSNMSVREWFARVSQSVSAMSQVDNASGSGTSDPFNTSSVKQQISRAFGLSANDTQTLIDKQFDILGESVGLVRGGATSSVVTLTFYTYVKPTVTVSFPVGILCATVPDGNTPSLTFMTTGSAVVDKGSAASFYDPVNGWWAVSVPASCQTAGSTTNAGAGTIRTIGSGAPAGWNITNPVAATFGQDDEINSKFASRIAVRQVTGVDSGTRDGYLTAALATPGVVAGEVVAAGDVEMQRDWDPIRQKHVFGCVDVYVQGNTSSEEDDIVAFRYQNSGTYGAYTSYLFLTLVSKSSQLVKFQIGSAAFRALPWQPYQGVELLVSSLTGQFFLGLGKAQFNNTDGFLILDPGDMAYQVTGSGPTQAYVPFLINGVPATNLAAVTYAGGSANYSLLARIQSPLSDVPENQPVMKVNSVVGQAGYTGAVPEALVTLVHHSDFLLDGGSNRAGDTAQVPSTASSPLILTIEASVPGGVPLPVLIDSGMDLPVDTNGVPGNVLSVRSTDSSILYSFGPGGDYVIVPAGPYRTYALLPQVKSVAITQVSISGNVLTVACANDFGTGAPILLGGIPAANAAAFLNGETVVVVASTGTAFTATYPGSDLPATAVTGTATGSAIQDQQKVVVAYNKFVVSESLSFASGEALTLNGSIPSALANQGFIQNAWQPPTYGTSYVNPLGDTVDGTVLVLDVDLIAARVPYASRYVKVLFQNGQDPPTYETMVEGVDFILAVDPISGLATIQRNTSVSGTSRIPDGGQVLVSYFYNEAFTVATEYPAFVPILANRIASTKHADADVLVKAMVANPVDVTLTVVLEQGISASTIDPAVRTAIDTVLDNAETTLYQSEIVAQVQAVPGVKSVVLPLTKCAKSDGSYDVAVVIPTGTAWTPLSQDPAFTGLAVPSNSFISSGQILPDSTVPSGGPADAFVGLLYQGQEYARATSVRDFLDNAATPSVSSENGSFYIIGANDQVSASAPLAASYAQKVILTIPADTPTPSLKSYFVTYVVEGETTASDVVLSSTEYVVPGRVTIGYVASGS
jgi:uncharacterized phage protein gp47/JayE